MYLLYIDFDKKATIILYKLREKASLERWKGKWQGEILNRGISFDKYDDSFSHL